MTLQGALITDCMVPSVRTRAGKNISTQVSTQVPRKHQPSATKVKHLLLLQLPPDRPGLLSSQLSPLLGLLLSSELQALALQDLGVTADHANLSETTSSHSPAPCPTQTAFMMLFVLLVNGSVISQPFFSDCISSDLSSSSLLCTQHRFKKNTPGMTTFPCTFQTVSRQCLFMDSPFPRPLLMEHKRLLFCFLLPF